MKVGSINQRVNVVTASRSSKSSCTARQFKKCML